MGDDDLIRRGDALALRDKLADIIGAQPMSSIHSALSEYRNAIRAIPAADARAEALLKRAAQMAYEVWDDPEALANAILALITEKQQ